jgi:exopolysaccharide biosynthesis polyprenyl glycosylphosphotransferase
MMLKIFSLPISPWKLILFCGDAMCYIISVIIALYFNHLTSIIIFEYVYEFKIYFISIGIVYLIVLFIADTYNYFKDFRHIINLVYVFIACWIGTLVVVLAFYFPLKGWIIGRTLLLIQALSFAILVSVWRFTFSVIALPQRLEKRLIIVGAGKSGRYLLDSLRARTGCGFLTVGFVDDDTQKVGTRLSDLPVLGDSSQLADLINEHKVNLAVVAITGKRTPRLTNNLIMVSWDDCRLIDMPTFYEFLTGKLPTDHISDDWIFDWSVNSRKIYYIRLKRLIDLTLAGILLMVASPLMLVVALLIKLDSKGPIFFMQERLGQKGKPFTIIKFRTMFQGAENNGPVWTDHNDPRITRIGRFIRKLRLDELPQLWNIIRGEMSFIGPRPLAHTSYMDNIDFYKYRTLVKPGITGWAQVTFPEGLTIDSTQEKLKYDLYYIKNIGFLLDLAILLKTVRTVIFGQGR